MSCNAENNRYWLAHLAKWHQKAKPRNSPWAPFIKSAAWVSKCQHCNYIEKTCWGTMYQHYVDDHPTELILITLSL